MSVAIPADESACMLMKLEFVPPTPNVPVSPENEKCRGQLRKLNSLSQALRGLQAKMHVLREESNRTLQESPDFGDFGRDLLHHYDSIGADLRGLVDEWENARGYLAMSVDKQDRADSPLASPESLDGTTLVGDTPRNSGLFTKDEMGGGWSDVAGFLASADEPEPDTEEVYESFAEPPQQKQRSPLTREERIKKVQEERVKVAEKRKNAEAELALQKELQTVLGNRPPPKRRYATRAFSR